MMKAVAPSIPFLALALSAQASTAHAAPAKPDVMHPANCELSQPARIVTSLRDLPEIRSEFQRQKLRLVDDRENSAGSSEANASHFVRAYIFSDKVVVWYEQRGGFVNIFHIVEMKKQGDSSAKFSPVLLRFTGNSLSGPPCAATEAILEGVHSIQGW